MEQEVLDAGNSKRRLSLREARAMLRNARELGLVSKGLYRGDGRRYWVRLASPGSPLSSTFHFFVPKSGLLAAHLVQIAHIQRTFSESQDERRNTR